MAAKIVRLNFRMINEITFSFNMTDHLDPGTPQDVILTAICKRLSNYHQQVFPNWTRLVGKPRIIQINPTDALFYYLDTESKTKVLNWLIFFRIKKEKNITVTHFGPFGKKKDDYFEEKVKLTSDALNKLKDRWLQVKSSEQSEEQKEASKQAIIVKIYYHFWSLMQGISEQSEEQKEASKQAITDEILAHFWSLMQGINENVVAKITELNDLSRNFFDEESIKRLTQKIEISIKITTGAIAVSRLLEPLVKEIMGQITKSIGKMAAKQAIKQTTKQGSKAVAKAPPTIVAKSTPFLGLGVGLGFGFWRLVKGDVAGAGLEITSGAASCVPGYGTAAAVGIDATLAARDMYNGSVERKKKMENLKAATERIEKELNDLFKQYKGAKAKHDFIGEISKDSGYDLERLQQDIRIVNAVLWDLNNN